MKETEGEEGGEGEIYGEEDTQGGARCGRGGGGDILGEEERGEKGDDKGGEGQGVKKTVGG